MASIAKRLDANVSGDLYVDSTCIDCATCREMAPETYAEGDAFSYVHRQPEDAAAVHRAMKALVACPTGSIGTVSRRDAQAAIAAFPEPIAEEVSFCGYTSKDSFGAWSYFVKPENGDAGAGSFLVDSPRAARPLVNRLRELGGFRLLLLTHRDDVADHAALHREFGCERVLHRRDVSSGTEGVERQPDGDEAVEIAPGLVMIPTPGHTRGHAVYLWRERFLFTGDHLAWSERRGHLYAFRSACWYDWDEQIRSMEKLLAFRFEWVLPGHGARYHAPDPDTMRRGVERCVDWMKRRR